MCKLILNMRINDNYIKATSYLSLYPSTHLFYNTSLNCSVGGENLHISQGIMDQSCNFKGAYHSGAIMETAHFPSKSVEMTQHHNKMSNS